MSLNNRNIKRSVAIRIANFLAEKSGMCESSRCYLFDKLTDVLEHEDDSILAELLDEIIQSEPKHRITYEGLI